MIGQPRETSDPAWVAWLLAAAQLPGKAHHVATALFFQACLEGCLDFSISITQVARTLGVDRTTAGRGLATLERGGLVRVRRLEGVRPLVTIRFSGSGVSGPGSSSESI